ncbi:cysteine hydrolase [Tetragenococcus halophilus]|uniref:isochorismatase family cysteine hydrolase n=1 Tax=Tetragenococcus halophilus TaxID=51669 RepID=UPI001F40E12E|nr:isochorismatase family cysteine hydrolase [Tetragenococcus halophilus]MCF1684116.1 cysteine hydrolase [Tetragenococcus halophilus]
MLVIIDMQNHLLQPDSKYYMPEAKKLVKRIAKRLSQARQKGEYVLHTQDIPIQYKNKADDYPDLQLIQELKPLANEHLIKKNYFSIPPEELLAIKQYLFKSKKEHKNIEITGVETDLCVLANTIEIQSAFPEADFFIDPSLVSSRKRHQETLKILQEFNIHIKNFEF